MKFEYELKYDFVSKEATFRIVKMPEKYRNMRDIVTIKSNMDNEWKVHSCLYPEINRWHEIYLWGGNKDRDCEPRTRADTDYSFILEAADVLKKLQAWIESQDEEVVMTIAEIEAKLGIKNLKIVKEGK